MSDDEEIESLVKTNPSFLNLHPSLHSVQWKVDLPVDIHITGVIDGKSISELEEALNMAQRSGQTVIPLVISSDGGSIYDVFKMVDLILTSNIPIITICRGYCMSAAALLFSCGDKRIIGPHASIMIHSVSSSILEGRLADVQVESKEMQRLTDMMTALMAENTGRKKDYYKKQLQSNTDIFYNAETALNCNLATHIGDFRLTTHVNVESKVEIIKSNKRKRD